MAMVVMGEDTVLMDAIADSRITMSWGHETGYGLHFGPWNHPEQFVLFGFDSFWDAWAFCIANGLPDPSAGFPWQVRQYQNTPPAEKSEPLQPELFSGIN